MIDTSNVLNKRYMNKQFFNIISLVFFTYSGFVFSQQLSKNNVDGDSSVTVTFSVVGDVMCHSTQFNYALREDSTYDFKPVYRKIKKYFDNSDVVIGNLETVVAGKDIEYSGYPVFNTPEDFLKGLKYAGFDILVTGNNHSYDHQKKGILNTIDFIRENGMKNTGTYKSQEERDSVQLFEQSGLKFALLSYTYGVNLYRIPEKNKFLVNRINPELIKHDIEKAKSKGADLVIIYFHFGKEYARTENRYQRNIVDKTIGFGADIILGAHPHTLQPVEFYKTVDANIDTGFVAFSLGNFISNQRWRYSDGGTVLNFSVTKDFKTNTIKLDAVRYLPIWIFKGVTSWGLEYLILPSDIAADNSYPSYFTEEDKELMLQCYNDTKELMESRTKYIVLDSIDKSAYRKWKIEQEKFISFIAKIPYKPDNPKSFVVKADSLEFFNQKD
ncbi:Capsule biosynthesis protein capA [hydrothermal vent metagenome]|uniref:Capsule biosynthesis protein capA n=1 Tax=hydrothermal vent metagenome TaxID=652676 RepID=A0A3B1D3Y7_9ZZZZ